MRALCVDPLNPAGDIDPTALTQLGFNAARVVLRSDPHVRAYIDLSHSVGVNVWGVVTPESGDPELYHGWPIDLAIVGNEMDTTGPSSSTMTPPEFYALWYRCVEVFRHVPKYVGGMASGHVYLAEPYVYVEDAAGMCVHPYNKNTTQARALLQAYKIAYGLPIIVDEWNRPAEEIAEFMAMLDAETAGHAWYCATQGMTEGFGLLDAPEKLAAWKEAMWVPEFKLGFKTLAEQLGAAVVGEPVGDERYYPDGITSVQYTSTGKMEYDKLANRTYFFPASQLPKV